MSSSHKMCERMKSTHQVILSLMVKINLLINFKYEFKTLFLNDLL